MNLAAFYDAIRGDFKLTNENVAGFDFLIKLARTRGLARDFLAYCLATAWHETAHTMQPVKEYGGDARANRLYGVEGRNPTRARRMGNTKPGDGARYMGRGYVQLTWKINYARVRDELGIDCVKNPDLMLEPRNAAIVMFVGMARGWFTGKDLDDYIDGIDEDDAEDLREFTNARAIINGRDKARAIAEYALGFQKALIAAGYGEPVTKPEPRPEVPGLDKPMSRSKTLWGAIAGALSTILTAFAGLDWRVQLALVVVAVLAGGLIIRERMKYRDIARALGV